MKLNVVRIVKAEFFAKLFSTKDETSHLDYLVSIVFANLIYAIASYFTNQWTDIIFALVHGVIIYPITIRRLHSLGKTGKTLLWIFTIIGILYVVYLLLFKRPPVATDIDNSEVVAPDWKSYPDPDPQYKNERLYVIFSILAMVSVFFISHYANNISSKSLYLNYSIVTPIILSEAGVISAEVSEMDEDGIVEALIVHVPMMPNEITWLKEIVQLSHCIEGFYKSNELFRYYDAKFVVTLRDINGNEDIVEVNNDVCSIITYSTESQKID